MVTAAMKSEDNCFGKKAMINLDGVLKVRDITLPTKVHIVKVQRYTWSFWWLPTGVRAGM